MSGRADGGHDPVAPTGRPTPAGARRAVVVRRLLIGAVVVLVAGLNLAGWVLWVPYRVPAQVAGAAATVDCETKIDWPTDAAGQADHAAFDRSCHDARSDRTKTAALIGAALVVAVAAATTVPSRRLTDLHRLGDHDGERPSA